MKKFLLFLPLLALSIYVNAQIINESFNDGTLPPNWQLAQGMKVDGYNNPLNNCQSDFGLLTPGVGGNNPAKILTTVYTLSNPSSIINIGFTIYIFDANLACASVKPLPCETLVQVYLVRSTYNSTAAPPPASEILGQSAVQVVNSNTANIIFVPLNNPAVTPGLQYRVLYDFSVRENCNQGGTKYILDELRINNTGGGPLPVKMGTFTATNKNNRIALNWSTETETNNAGFEVERKAGNGAYEKIGFVASKAVGATGGGYQYSFEDAAFGLRGMVQYRLKQLDLDGKATYSEIRAVRLGNSNISLTIYPNPSRGTTNIVLPDGAGTMDVTLENFSGTVVQRWNGLSNRNMQLNNLRPGVYMLRILVKETGEQLVERIMVQ